MIYTKHELALARALRQERIANVQITQILDNPEVGALDAFKALLRARGEAEEQIRRLQCCDHA